MSLGYILFVFRNRKNDFRCLKTLAFVRLSDNGNTVNFESRM